ncbi:MAG: biotin--[acetyl-CoA-carboxylase] ligase [Flavobacteriaceae bacterium]
MRIIKLDATDSTNTHLKFLVQSGLAEDLTTVVAKQQRNGRGQMGTRWQSEPGKNLTFSVLKLLDGMAIENVFQLNVMVSLGIVAALEQLQIPDVSVKWPNDIMSGNLKICGILIENTFSNGQIQS